MTKKNDCALFGAVPCIFIVMYCDAVSLPRRILQTISHFAMQFNDEHSNKLDRRFLPNERDARYSNYRLKRFGI